MPLRNVAGSNLVFCINHQMHASSGLTHDTQTSMVIIGNGSNQDAWYALTEVKPKTSPLTNVQFMPSSGHPFRVYTCLHCGYTEIYHGQIISKDIWK